MIDIFLLYVMVPYTLIWLSVVAVEGTVEQLGWSNWVIKFWRKYTEEPRGLEVSRTIRYSAKE